MTSTADAGRIVLVGAGRMGGALLRGWLALGVPGERLHVLEPQPGAELVELCRAAGVRLNAPAEVVGVADVVLLAVKPQMLDEASPSMASIVGEKTLLVSVVAGKTVADLSRRFPAVGRVVRAMPNTPAAVGRGITGVFASGPVDAAGRATVDRLLGSVGRVEWLDHEHLIDAVTAVSGSGPAYVFYLTECLAKAGAGLGLDAALAARLARATVEGAGELMFSQADQEPDVLRRNVTSPGGTTAAALEVLAGPMGLEDLMTRTVAAARRRAEELAG